MVDHADSERVVELLGGEPSPCARVVQAVRENGRDTFRRVAWDVTNPTPPGVVVAAHLLWGSKDDAILADIKFGAITSRDVWERRLQVARAGPFPALDDDQYRLWRDRFAGVSDIELSRSGAEWWAENYPDPDTAAGLFAALTADALVDVDAEMVTLAFTSDVDEWQTWRATDQEIVRWSQAGSSPQDALQWLAHRPDMTPAIAERLDISDLYGWSRTSIPTRLLSSWKSTGLPAALADRWYQSPRTAAETTHMYGHGFFTLDEFQWWEKCLNTSVYDHLSRAVDATWETLCPHDDPQNRFALAVWWDERTARTAGFRSPNRFTLWRDTATVAGNHYGGAAPTSETPYLPFTPAAAARWDREGVDPQWVLGMIPRLCQRLSADMDLLPDLMGEWLPDFVSRTWKHQDRDGADQTLTAINDEYLPLSLFDAVPWYAAGIQPRHAFPWFDDLSGPLKGCDMVGVHAWMTREARRLQWGGPSKSAPWVDAAAKFRGSLSEGVLVADLLRSRGVPVAEAATVVAAML